jgi:hypothetical protein
MAIVFFIICLFMSDWKNIATLTCAAIGITVLFSYSSGLEVAKRLNIPDPSLGKSLMMTAILFVILAGLAQLIRYAYVAAKRGGRG